LSYFNPIENNTNKKKIIYNISLILILNFSLLNSIYIIYYIKYKRNLFLALLYKLNSLILNILKIILISINNINLKINFVNKNPIINIIKYLINIIRLNT